ncbi:MAG: universal stress protein [Nitrospirae bacterium]|nr:universal stress protein [Nitrospirota bacterium]
MYKTIVTAFDGSEFSKKALEHACRLSKTDYSEITAMYVIPRYEEMVGFLRTESIKRSLFREAQKILDEAKKTALSHGVFISATIQEGQAAEKITETAKLLKSDLVVMGSYGWGGINKVIIGSTAERVIMNASCPVLVVK